MNTKMIIIGVISVIVIYYLYQWIFGSPKETTLVTTQDARKLKVINASTLPSSSTSDYSYSIWFYINDWNYRFGESKVIFGRVDKNNDPSPSVTLAPSVNDLNVTMNVYPNDDTTARGSNLFTCSIKDVPLQKWTNLILSLNNRAMDLYLDGKLVKTCIMPGVPKMNPNANVIVSPDGGFSGFISNFKYIAYSVNPTEAYDIYKSGYGGNSMFSSILNKYRIKFAFLEDNKEVNSFEL